jgi:hypothetical protein
MNEYIDDEKKYLNLISSFLKTGNFIETDNVEIINSLSSYIVYTININQRKNLFLTLEYRDFINILKINNYKLSSIRSILNLTETYKLKELNDNVSQISSNKIENIIIDDINFNIKDIFDSYLEFINSKKIEINYSKFIFSSNKKKKLYNKYT